jgi:hypothetical protein
MTCAIVSALSGVGIGRFHGNARVALGYVEHLLLTALR